MVQLRFRRRRLWTPELRFAGLPVFRLPGGLRVVTADSRPARRDGLAGLRTLDDDTALWIAPCRSIHTLGMRFAIDLVWLDGEDQVLCVDPAVPRRSQRTRPAARSVLETAAGRGDAFARAWSGRSPGR